jgi:hypothetical protein
MSSSPVFLNLEKHTVTSLRVDIATWHFYISKKFWKVHIAYFPLTRHGLHRKRRLQQFFYSCVCILRSRWLATIRGYTFTHRLTTSIYETHRSVAMEYIPSFVNIGSGIWNTEKSLIPYRNRTPAAQPVASRYTNWAIPAHGKSFLRLYRNTVLARRSKNSRVVTYQNVSSYCFKGPKRCRKSMCRKSRFAWE